ncbi:CpaD family pilus assembly lipoprotein [Sneathiella sp.]|uniref:CpaD family pilus assembly lipoprotein n=1 Tax=Sneathiella sp. TaxID=1964365 RepID=UPI0026121387|nr:CpaD family pilus assembly lipoprotein [Sneathiella sp.]MDF2368850.1 CpaD family pilus assembly lipoprotein [Sneathiella sp.]
MQQKLFMKSATLASLMGMLLLTASCTSPEGLFGSYDNTATPEKAKLEKKITVSELTPTLIVDFEAGRGRLADMEKGKLLGFIEAQDIEFGETVEVEFPNFQGSNGLNEQRFAEVATFLQDRGFSVAPRATKENAPDSLRVYFVKYVATVDPNCQKGWYKPEGMGYENLPLPYMGCANADALAGMIANPRDLVDPASESSAIGERAAKAVEQYRAGTAGAASASSE